MSEPFSKWLGCVGPTRRFPFDAGRQEHKVSTFKVLKISTVERTTRLKVAGTYRFDWVFGVGLAGKQISSQQTSFFKQPRRSSKIRGGARNPVVNLSFIGISGVRLHCI